jgi:mono/diheme cytochrome c family protein
MSIFDHNVKLTAAAAVALLAGCATVDDHQAMRPSGTPALGRVATAAEVAAADISIPPSGAGLPAGRGTVKQGEAVYAAQCQSCHGARGAGKPADALVGGAGTLAGENALRTVASYWPHATTLFDYTRRAMPLNRPQSLSNDEVYAVTAYVLHVGGILPADAALDAQTLAQVRMPNRDGFVDRSMKR